MSQWDRIKESVEGRKHSSILDEVPAGFPPLLKAFKYQKKAAKKARKEAQKNALINARAKAKALINGDMVKAIEDGYGSFDTWLDTRIEQTVRETKK